IATIGRQDILDVLRRSEAQGHISTAKRLRAELAAIFDFAGAEGLGLVEANPANMVRKAMAHAVTVNHPAITTLPELLELLRAVEATDCQPIFNLAMRFLALTAARPGMVLGATWDEIEGLDDGANMALWRVSAHRMKTRQEWISPLVGAAVDVL